jgi:PAS domain S-box-containing protein
MADGTDFDDCVFATAHDPLAVLDQHLRIVRVSDAFSRQFHIPASRVVGMPVSTLDGGRWNLPELIRLLETTLRSGAPVRGEILEADLGTGPRTIIANARCYGPSIARQILLALQDITDRVATAGECSDLSSAASTAAEEALHVTLQRMQAIVSHLPMVVWTLDRNGIVKLSEGRLLEKLGFAPGELVGRSALEMYRDSPDIVFHIKRALAGELEHFTVAVGGMTLESWYVPVKASDGGVDATIGVALDVTERVKLEEQFRQSQKMEAVGRLAGGIAHDFNNLLTAILGYADLVLEQLPAESAMAADMDQIRKAGLSASSLTRQLLAFSRRQMLKPEIICINDVIARMEVLLTRVIGENIALTTSLASDLANVSADPGQVEQVILNLSVNARDAMPKGGDLRIETANVDLDAVFAAAHVGAGTGPHVMVRVTDTGTGMDDTVRKHVFEPFFTTKEKAKGTGLGLSTVYGIVQQSGGSIWVESEPGRGATFVVYLPIVDAPVSAQSEAPLSPLQTGDERILLVEDQDDVRDVARAILRHAGYTVIDASRPRTALAMVQDGIAFDLLLTDVVMPQMSGRDLAKAVAGMRPDVKVLYMSGYAEDAIVKHGVLDPGLAFVPKPFTPKDLLKAVRSAIDAGQQTRCR